LAIRSVPTLPSADALPFGLASEEERVWHGVYLRLGFPKSALTRGTQDLQRAHINEVKRIGKEGLVDKLERDMGLVEEQDEEYENIYGDDYDREAADGMGVEGRLVGSDYTRFRREVQTHARFRRHLGQRYPEVLMRNPSNADKKEVQARAQQVLRAIKLGILTESDVDENDWEWWNQTLDTLQTEGKVDAETAKTIVDFVDDPTNGIQFASPLTLGDALQNFVRNHRDQLNIYKNHTGRKALSADCNVKDGLYVSARMDTGTKPGQGGLDSFFPMPNEAGVYELGDVNMVRGMHEYLRDPIDNPPAGWELTAHRWGDPAWYKAELDAHSQLKKDQNTEETVKDMKPFSLLNPYKAFKLLDERGIPAQKDSADAWKTGGSTGADREPRVRYRDENAGLLVKGFATRSYDRMQTVKLWDVDNMSLNQMLYIGEFPPTFQMQLERLYLATVGDEHSVPSDQGGNKHSAWRTWLYELLAEGAGNRIENDEHVPGLGFDPYDGWRAQYSLPAIIPYHQFTTETSTLFVHHSPKASAAAAAADGMLATHLPHAKDLARERLCVYPNRLSGVARMAVYSRMAASDALLRMQDNPIADVGYGWRGGLVLQEHQKIQVRDASGKKQDLAYEDPNPDTPPPRMTACRSTTHEQRSGQSGGSQTIVAPTYVLMLDFNDFQMAMFEGDREWDELMHKYEDYFLWADKYTLSEDWTRLTLNPNYVHAMDAVPIRTPGSWETYDAPKPGGDGEISHENAVRPASRMRSSWFADRKAFGTKKKSESGDDGDYEDCEEFEARVEQWTSLYKEQIASVYSTKSTLIAFEKRIAELQRAMRYTSMHLCWFAAKISDATRDGEDVQRLLMLNQVANKRVETMYAAVLADSEAEQEQPRTSQQADELQKLRDDAQPELLPALVQMIDLASNANELRLICAEMQKARRSVHDTLNAMSRAEQKSALKAHPYVKLVYETMANYPDGQLVDEMLIPALRGIQPTMRRVFASVPPEWLEEGGVVMQDALMRMEWSHTKMYDPRYFDFYNPELERKDAFDAMDFLVHWCQGKSENFDVGEFPLHHGWVMYTLALLDSLFYNMVHKGSLATTFELTDAEAGLGGSVAQEESLKQLSATLMKTFSIDRMRVPRRARQCKAYIPALDRGTPYQSQGGEAIVQYPNQDLIALGKLLFAWNAVKRRRETVPEDGSGAADASFEIQGIDDRRLLYYKEVVSIDYYFKRAPVKLEAFDPAVIGVKQSSVLAGYAMPMDLEDDPHHAMRMTMDAVAHLCNMLAREDAAADAIRKALTSRASSDQPALPGLSKAVQQNVAVPNGLQEVLNVYRSIRQTDEAQRARRNADISSASKFTLKCVREVSNVLARATRDLRQARQVLVDSQWEQATKDADGNSMEVDADGGGPASASVATPRFEFSDTAPRFAFSAIGVELQLPSDWMENELPGDEPELKQFRQKLMVRNDLLDDPQVILQRTTIWRKQREAMSALEKLKHVRKEALRVLPGVDDGEQELWERAEWAREVLEQQARYKAQIAESQRAVAYGVAKQMHVRYPGVFPDPDDAKKIKDSVAEFKEGNEKAKLAKAAAKKKEKAEEKEQLRRKQEAAWCHFREIKSMWNKSSALVVSWTLKYIQKEHKTLRKDKFIELLYEYENQVDPVTNKHFFKNARGRIVFREPTENDAVEYVPYPTRQGAKKWIDKEYPQWKKWKFDADLPGKSGPAFAWWDVNNVAQDVYSTSSVPNKVEKPRWLRGIAAWKVCQGVANGAKQAHRQYWDSVKEENRTSLEKEMIAGDATAMLTDDYEEDDDRDGVELEDDVWNDVEAPPYDPYAPVFDGGRATSFGGMMAFTEEAEDVLDQKRTERGQAHAAQNYSAVYQAAAEVEEQEREELEALLRNPAASEEQKSAALAKESKTQKQFSRGAKTWIEVPTNMTAQKVRKTLKNPDSTAEQVQLALQADLFHQFNSIRGLHDEWFSTIKQQLGVEQMDAEGRMVENTEAMAAFKSFSDLRDMGNTPEERKNALKKKMQQITLSRLARELEAFAKNAPADSLLTEAQTKAFVTMLNELGVNVENIEAQLGNAPEVQAKTLISKVQKHIEKYDGEGFSVESLLIAMALKKKDDVIKDLASRIRKDRKLSEKDLKTLKKYGYSDLLEQLEKKAAELVDVEVLNTDGTTDAEQVPLRENVSTSDWDLSPLRATGPGAAAAGPSTSADPIQDALNEEGRIPMYAKKLQKAIKTGKKKAAEKAKKKQERELRAMQRAMEAEDAADSSDAPAGASTKKRGKQKKQPTPEELEEKQKKQEAKERRLAELEEKRKEDLRFYNETGQEWFERVYQELNPGKKPYMMSAKQLQRANQSKVMTAKQREKYLQERAAQRAEYDESSSEEEQQETTTFNCSDALNLEKTVGGPKSIVATNSRPVTFLSGCIISEYIELIYDAIGKAAAGFCDESIEKLENHQRLENELMYSWLPRALERRQSESESEQWLEVSKDDLDGALKNWSSLKPESDAAFSSETRAAGGWRAGYHDYVRGLLNVIVERGNVAMTLASKPLSPLNWRRSARGAGPYPAAFSPETIVNPFFETEPIAEDAEPYNGLFETEHWPRLRARLNVMLEAERKFNRRYGPWVAYTFDASPTAPTYVVDDAANAADSK
jgi:hypothetical protein